MTAPLTIACAVHFRRHGHGGAKEVQPGAEPTSRLPPRLPRVARLMALAIRLDHLVRTGAVKDCATLAKLGRVSPARISQITNLIHLSPAIQEALLFLPPIQRGRAPLILADLQPIAALADWDKQRRRWHALAAGAQQKPAY